MRRPSLVSIVGSIFVRLPLGFAIPFIVLAGTWTLSLFKLARDLLQVNHFRLWSNLDDILLAAITIAIYGVGIVVMYNISVMFNWLWVRYGPAPLPCDRIHPHRTNLSGRDSKRFKDIKKIGIVLAGGGAKGAFQAGAMKAICRHLEEHNALEKVAVISGTSIGSWNTLFWLANLVRPDKGWGHGRSVHENWWRSISLKSLVAPSWYIPCCKNAFFTTAPWQRLFDGIFCQAEIKEQIVNSKIHFYLTRSQVRSGKLECATNNPAPTRIPRVNYHILDRSKGADDFLQGVKDGVFASMDLPPLFPYAELEEEFFEDGGVIDNLPIMFAAMEQCDLIFVLPLNSDFTAEPDPRSVINRFFRVMDVRQGALERNSMKILYLYNELAVLRDYAHSLEAELGSPSPRQFSATLESALNRTHQHSRIFAVCPHRTFVERTIDTQELWKSRQAGRAFDVMYKATCELLERRFDPSHERIQVALINEGGDFTWDDNF